jgi:hypothetical protein
MCVAKKTKNDKKSQSPSKLSKRIGKIVDKAMRRSS